MKKIFSIFIFFSLLPFALSAAEENCYGSKVFSAGKSGYFNFLGETCQYPEAAGSNQVGNKDGIEYPFSGFSTYRWYHRIPGKESMNVSVTKDLSDCGTKNDPCYCDDTINRNNIDFKKYCCPGVGDCPRRKDLQYVNRPYYTIMDKRGNMEIKGNLAVSGGDNYFLADNPIVRFISAAHSTVIRFKKNVRDAWVAGTIKIGRDLLFQEKSGDIALGEKKRISKSRRNKIIASPLQGRKQSNAWLEISANDLSAPEFKDLSGIASGVSSYYLADRAAKKVYKINGASAVSIGNSDWAWEPGGLAVDGGGSLYVASTFDEYPEDLSLSFQVVRPSRNAVFKSGEKISIAWSNVPGASNYQLNLIKNGIPQKVIGVRDGTSNYQLSEKEDHTGHWAAYVSAVKDGRTVNTGNYGSFIVVRSGADIFRLKSPAHKSIFYQGDTIPFTWDGLSSAAFFRLAYSFNGGAAVELSDVSAPMKELDTSSAVFASGDYVFFVRAFDSSGKPIKETINKLPIIIKPKEMKRESVRNNIFKLKISGQDQTDQFVSFLPAAGNLEENRNFEIVREYLMKSNNDPFALNLDGPEGVSVYGDYLYIADSGHGRVVRLRNIVAVPPALAKPLLDLRAAHGNGWESLVDAGLKAQIDDYWQVVYGAGAIQGDRVNRISNFFAPRGPLKNPQDVHIESGFLYISDTGNKRIVLEANDRVPDPDYERWFSLAMPFAVPWGLYKKDNYLYVADIKNGSIVRININQSYSGMAVSDTHSYFYNSAGAFAAAKGMVFNDTYFVLGRRGQERYEFSAPIDIIFQDGYFHIVDGVAPSGFLLAAGDQNNVSSSGLVGLQAGGIGPFSSDYRNEFNANTLAASVSVDESVSLYNNEADKLRKWKKGPAVSHCISNCSDGFQRFTSNWCSGSRSWEIDCGGCADANRTCRDQWDWEANAPSCQYRVINSGAYSVTDCCAGMCTYQRSVTTTSIDPVTRRTVTRTVLVPYQECCPSAHTEYAPSCQVQTFNCRVGYSVSFEDYSNPTDFSLDPSSSLEAKVQSAENTNLSKKEGWADYVY